LGYRKLLTFGFGLAELVKDATDSDGEMSVFESSVVVADSDETPAVENQNDSPSTHKPGLNETVTILAPTYLPEIVQLPPSPVFELRNDLNPEVEDKIDSTTENENQLGVIETISLSAPTYLPECDQLPSSAISENNGEISDAEEHSLLTPTRKASLNLTVTLSAPMYLPQSSELPSLPVTETEVSNNQTADVENENDSTPVSKNQPNLNETVCIAAPAYLPQSALLPPSAALIVGPWLPSGEKS
jgi:hypothetical protein